MANKETKLKLMSLALRTAKAEKRSVPILGWEESKKKESGNLKQVESMEKVFDNEYLTVSIAKRRRSSATSSELSQSSDDDPEEEVKRFEVVST